jgi:alanine racemase
MDSSTASTWLEIDLDAIRSNVATLRKIAGVPIMAVVKGNGYGHGIVEATRAAMEGGAAWLAVARLEEAQMIRSAGFESPILVMGFTHPKRAAEAAETNATLTAYDPKMAKELSIEACNAGVVIPVHVKIDTGMRRLGVFSENGVEFIQMLRTLPGIDISGMYTHLPRIDEVDHPTTTVQANRYKKLISQLEALNIRPALIHGSSSAGILNKVDVRFDMLRSGIAIYGQQASDDVRLGEDFKVALTWKARVISIKIIPAGEGVGYNHRYFTQKDERIGVIGAGYGDGLRRRQGNFVLVGGKRLNVVGGMCMDQCMVNLDEVPDVKVGDEAVIIGSQGSETITPEEIGKAWNTTNYEVICGIHARVPRFYSK